MTLPAPNLDDRDFAQLLEEARRRAGQLAPDWNDLSPSDPGMVLLELFAHLTETMIYRLNRLPEKAYLAFLNLLGVRLAPPGAASVTLRFRRVAGGQAVDIPRGTRVTTTLRPGGGPPPVFATAAPARIAAGETETEVLAHHCELVEAEQAATATGLPGLSLTVARPPIVAPTGDPLDLVVGVEATADELDERSPALQHGGRAYRVWREVEHFANFGEDRHVYVADRAAGTITFAPAVRAPGGTAAEALAAVPEAGRGVLLWYRAGGGPEGNLPAGALTALRVPIPGVEVTNPAPATGGRAAETLDNALLRGPQSVHSLDRAVTARDFEILALRSSGGVARAKAFTRATLWVHAVPGTVELLLVPAVPDGPITEARLAEHQTDAALAEVRSALEPRRPVATEPIVTWGRCKTAVVSARIVVRREEDLEAVRSRVLARLHGSITPLPSDYSRTGWRFGEALRSSNVYDIVLSEPGVRYVDRVRLLVDEVPGTAVEAVAADRFQPRTWYAASESTLFRSGNDGEGWEPAGRFPGERVTAVSVSATRPGLLAVATTLADESSAVHLSFDCGERWTSGGPIGFGVNDLALSPRTGAPVLLLATDRGLYELAADDPASPVQVVVDAADPDRGFYGVVSSVDATGGINVALAARDAEGVFLSSEAGREGTFRRIGLVGEDVRVLAVQHDGPRSFLWAGMGAVGPDDPGRGCYRWELRGSADPPEGWRPFTRQWSGGVCWSLDFQGATVLAATNSAGVLRLDSTLDDPAWEAPDVRCGLPLRDPSRFHPVRAVAVGPAASPLLTGGPEGVSRSDDGRNYATCSDRVFTERVTLPQTWLFCSGQHDLEVVSEVEAGRD